MPLASEAKLAEDLANSIPANLRRSKIWRLSILHYREIWCSNRETGRFDEKLGDSRENRESWQVCNSQKDLAILKNISTFHGLLKGILKVKAGAALPCFVQKIDDVVTVFHIMNSLLKLSCSKKN